jgi:glycosyltransferase involved in cell wall biosynthesis
VTASTPRLSLVLPCYNGAGYIQETLATLFEWLSEIGRAHV